MFVILLITVIVSSNVFATSESEKFDIKISPAAEIGESNKSKKGLTQEKEEVDIPHEEDLAKADEALNALVKEIRGHETNAARTSTTAVEELETFTSTPLETLLSSPSISLVLEVDRKNQPDNSRTLMEAKSVMNSLPDNLPEVLKSKILITDEAEEEVLDSYSNSQSVPSEILSEHNASRKEESELFGPLLAESEPSATQLPGTYRALTKGKVWNYTKPDEKSKTFFQQPSAALAEFEASKSDEVPNYSRTLLESKSLRQSILNELPESLKSKILLTDDAENRVLESYVSSQSVPTETVSAYKTSRKEERELLKRLLAQAGTSAAQILATYKTLRNGVPWNYTKVDDKFRTFFKHSSPARTAYEALKLDELESIDSFLIGPAQFRSKRSSEQMIDAAESSPKVKQSDITEAKKAMARAETHDKVRTTYRKKRVEMSRAEAEEEEEEEEEEDEEEEEEVEEEAMTEGQRTSRPKDVKTTKVKVALKPERGTHTEPRTDALESFTIISESGRHLNSSTTVIKHSTVSIESDGLRRNNDLLDPETMLWSIAPMITVVIILVVYWRQVAEWLTKNKRREVTKADSLNPNNGRRETVITIQQ